MRINKQASELVGGHENERGSPRAAGQRESDGRKPASGAKLKEVERELGRAPKRIVVFINCTLNPGRANVVVRINIKPRRQQDNGGKR